jgi:hypothetical protein
MQVVTDAISNRNEHIEDAVRAIGRSKARLDVFTAVYRGRKAIKSVSEIAASEGMTTKQVLEAGIVLARAGLVTASKRGEMCYGKISSVAHVRPTILRMVNNPSLLQNLPTKRRPASPHTGELFKLVPLNSKSARKTRSHATRATPKVYRIAMLIASPIGQDAIDVGLEARELGVELRKSPLRDKFDLQVYNAATTESLLKALNEQKPQILHFSGHGSFGGLQFDNASIDDSGGSTIDFDVLRKLLATAPLRPKLMFLNACQSVGGAAGLVDVCDIVIAMRDTVNDSTAFHYARRFYASLLTGLNVEASHEQAKIVLSIDDPAGANLPVISCAAGVDPKLVAFT